MRKPYRIAWGVTGAVIALILGIWTWNLAVSGQGPTVRVLNQGPFEVILKDTGTTDPSAILQRLFITAHNESLSTSFENIWNGPTGLRPQPGPSGVFISLISTDADDTFGGSGAQVVRVNCLDTSGDAFFKDVQMAGTSLSSPMSTACFRIQPPSGVIQKGSSGGNEGEISFVSSDESPDQVYEIIPLAGDGSGAGHTSSGAFVVPNGHVIYIEAASWTAAVTDPQTAFTGLLKVLLPVVGFRSETVPLSGSGGRDIGQCFPARTEFQTLATLKSGSGKEMSASFVGRLVIKADGICG